LIEINAIWLHGDPALLHSLRGISGKFIMATYFRGDVTIVTAVEELVAGRYRGFLTFDTEAGQWRYDCPKCHGTPLEARADADADLEYAYRRYLTIPLVRNDSGTLH
jgi:hypothetical protein